MYVDLLGLLHLTSMGKKLSKLACSGQIKANEWIARRAEVKIRHAELRMKARLDFALRNRDSKILEELRFHTSLHLAVLVDVGCFIALCQ